MTEILLGFILGSCYFENQWIGLKDKFHQWNCWNIHTKLLRLHHTAPQKWCILLARQSLISFLLLPTAEWILSSAVVCELRWWGWQRTFRVTLCTCFLELSLCPTPYPHSLPNFSAMSPIKSLWAELGSTLFGGPVSPLWELCHPPHFLLSSYWQTYNKTYFHCCHKFPPSSWSDKGSQSQ